MAMAVRAAGCETLYCTRTYVAPRRTAWVVRVRWQETISTDRAIDLLLPVADSRTQVTGNAASRLSQHRCGRRCLLTTVSTYVRTSDSNFGRTGGRTSAGRARAPEAVVGGRAVGGPELYWLEVIAGPPKTPSSPRGT